MQPGGQVTFAAQYPADERSLRFAYPYGGKNNFRPEFLPITREIGYEACFSALNGFIRPNMRGQILPREAMPYFRSLTNLELHLSGCLDWFYSAKRSVGLL